MQVAYQSAKPHDSAALIQFLAKESQFLLPMVELIQHAHVVIDELIDERGKRDKANI